MRIAITFYCLFVAFLDERQQAHDDNQRCNGQYYPSLRERTKVLIYRFKFRILYLSGCVELEEFESCGVDGDDGVVGSLGWLDVWLGGAVCV